MTETTAAPVIGRRLGAKLGSGGALAAIMLFTVGFAVCLGTVPVPPMTVLAVVLDHLLPGMIDRDISAGQASIVWQIRLPRVILAGLVGAGLGLVGAALQSVTRNPLADPHLLGISSGGAFGAIAALLHTGMFLGALTVPLMAFAGALMATALVLGVARMSRACSADRLVLTGVAVSFVIMALANILIFLGDPRATHTVVFWMLGGLGLAQWSHLPWPLAVLLPCGFWLWSRSGSLNAMSLGDETASSLGIEVERFRLSIFVAAALITGVMVAFSGLIGFVGLMMPHLVRLVLGGDNNRVLPGSAFAGAVFLIAADALARFALAPEDIPVGVVTGLCGGVFFIWMMSRKA